MALLRASVMITAVWERFGGGGVLKCGSPFKILLLLDVYYSSLIVFFLTFK